MGPPAENMKISYLRPVKFQPGRLEVLASTAYTTHVIGILRKHRHYFSDAVCLRVLRRSLGDHLTAAVARTVREELFRYGCHVLQKEGAWSAVRDFQVTEKRSIFVYCRPRRFLNRSRQSYESVERECGCEQTLQVRQWFFAIPYRFRTLSLSSI
jgi:hypothetical protein